MKITKTDTYHNVKRLTECVFDIEDVAPIPVTSYGVRELQPQTTTIRVEDGEVVGTYVHGPSITRAGHGTERRRSFYSYERNEAPSWLRELIGLAQAAYRAEHGEMPTDGCGGPVFASYTTDDDGIHLACQACTWRKALGFWPDASQITAQARHEAKETAQ